MLRINYRKNWLVCPSRNPTRVPIEPPASTCLKILINSLFDSRFNKRSIGDVELSFNEWFVFALVSELEVKIWVLFRYSNCLFDFILISKKPSNLFDNLLTFPFNCCLFNDDKLRLDIDFVSIKFTSTFQEKKFTKREWKKYFFWK